MGVKISDVAAKGSSDGTELIAVSDSETAKSITTANIKDYTVAEIEGLTPVGSVTGADGIYILQSNALELIDIDLVAQYAIDIIWAKAKEATPVDADEMALKDAGGTEKTVLLSVLAEYVRATIEAAILDISDLTSHSPIAADYMLVEDGGVGKKCTFQDIIDGIYAGFAAHITGLGAATPADGDEFYVRNGGVGKKMTLAQIVAHVGNPVTGPGSTTEDYIPQWTDTNDDLKDGLAVVTGSFGAGVATAVATTASIRGEMNTIVDDASDIGDDILDSDEILVDDTSTSQKKSQFIRVWTWLIAKLAAVTDVKAYTWVLDDDTMAANDDTKLCTQQSIKAYVDGEAVTWDGDITDIDLDGGSDIAADLADEDLILVDDGAIGTNRKSQMSRIWTYIQNKIGVITYDTIWVPANIMTPSVTRGAGTEIHEYSLQDMNHFVLLYDGLAQNERAEFDIVMPDSWDRGPIKYKLYWAAGDAAANFDEWVQFYMAAGARKDDWGLDTVLGDIVYVADQCHADEDLNITAASSDLTVGGNPALGDMIHFKLTRVFDYTGGGTAMDVDARVFGVLIQYEKSQDASEW